MSIPLEAVRFGERAPDSVPDRVLDRVRAVRWPVVWTPLVVALLVWGSQAHLERFITPQRGVGYALGILGGSTMVLSLLYSLRKRVLWLRWLGSIPAWFEFHMVLGIVGPILILFHSNFSLGATNSNVALLCMVSVAGSGFMGRYIYTKLHARLGDHKDSLEHLKLIADRLLGQPGLPECVPALLDVIDRVEKRLLQPPHGVATRILFCATSGPRVLLARWLIRRECGSILNKRFTANSPTAVQLGQRIASIVCRYGDRRLATHRRTAEYQLYARLFSLWHIVHIPLFFMLLIAGVVHVLAINIY